MLWCGPADQPSLGVHDKWDEAGGVPGFEVGEHLLKRPGQQAGVELLLEYCSTSILLGKQLLLSPRCSQVTPGAPLTSRGPRGPEPPCLP